MKAKEFEREFDESGDITPALDVSRLNRPGQKQRRVNDADQGRPRTRRRHNSLSDQAEFDLVGRALGRDLRVALRTALSGGVVFAKGRTPLAIFRAAVSEAIRSIESHPRGRLLQRFLVQGPYEREGKIPPEMIGHRLTDEECARAIAFVFSFMVNRFKGAIAELLASQACLRLVREQLARRAPAGTRLYVGDSVAVPRARGKGRLMGADLHLLSGWPVRGSRSSLGKGGSLASPGSGITVVGVAEVKSYVTPAAALSRQLDGHVQRARRGLWVSGVEFPPERVVLGVGREHKVVRITVGPANWKLPRTFHFEESNGRRMLRVDPGVPRESEDRMEQVGPDDWKVTLRWSEEALAEAALEVSFWYMAKVGEVVFAQAKPKEWSEMSPAEAGRNSAKMMLYYAILRARTRPEEQRAIALYNAYGFGYALGAGFQNAKGNHEMLWPQDLDEILERGRTKQGCVIR